MILKLRTHGSHSHIAIIKEDGFAKVTTEKNHEHELFLGEYGWEVEEADGHTHELDPYELDPQKVPDEEDERKVSEVIQFHKQAQEYDFQNKKNAEQSERFYCIDQWEGSDRKILEASDRAPLTIPISKAKMDVLCGTQRQNRTDIKCYPREGGDTRIGEILDICIKTVLDQNNWNQKESKIFRSSAAFGRGLCSVNYSRNKTIEGDIVIDEHPWRDVSFGPHEKEDLSDCEYMLVKKVISKTKVIQMWGEEKAKDVSPDYLSDRTDPDEVLHRVFGHQYSVSENKITVDSSNGSITLVDDFKKEYLALELWRKVYRKVYKITDDLMNEIGSINKSDKTKIESLGFKVWELDEQDIRITRTVGMKLMSDEIDDTLPRFDGQVNFAIVCAYGNKIGNKWWGKIYEVIDSQKELNKRSSQRIDLLNRASLFFWYYSDDTFDEIQERQFKEHASSPGAVIKGENYDQPPRAIQGPNVPEAVFKSELEAMKQMDIVMNISPEMQGFGGNDISGKAIQEKRKSNLVGNEHYFDNLDTMKIEVAKQTIGYMSKYWTPERFLRIIRAKQNSNPEFQVPYNPEDEEAIRTILSESSNILKYDIKAELSPQSPTTRSANFAIWSEINARTGGQIPLEFLLEISDLPEKRKFKAIIEGKKQAEAESENKKYEAQKYQSDMAAMSKMQTGGNQGAVP